MSMEGGFFFFKISKSDFMFIREMRVASHSKVRLLREGFFFNCLSSLQLSYE